MSVVCVFVDSDVVISSLLSQKGAAYLLLTASTIKRFISNISQLELERVAKRLTIDGQRLIQMLDSRVSIITLATELEAVKEAYHSYVTDLNDAHIVAGAVQAKTKFLITYNMRDFKADKIKQDFGIIVLQPGSFLQYVRSKS